MDDKDMMASLEKAKKVLLTEVDKITQTGTLTKETLCLMKEALDVLEKIAHIERGQDPDMGGYSNKNYYIKSWDYPNGGGENSYGKYPMMGGDSYARGRSPMTGRYVSRDNGMSRTGDHEYMIRNLEMAMNEAGSEQERMQIQNLISQMKSGRM